MTATIAVIGLPARRRWPANDKTLSGITSNPAMTLNASESFSPRGPGNARLPVSSSSTSIARKEPAYGQYTGLPLRQQRPAACAC